MNNLLLYINTMECTSITSLLQHIKVEEDIVYVTDEVYSNALYGFRNWYNLETIKTVDSLIYNVTKCNHFKFIKSINNKIFVWDNKTKQYR